MTGKEIDNFLKTDKKLYELKNNEDFLTFLKEKIKQGYHPIYEIETLQNFIDEIVNFFEFKYPDAMFYSTHDNERNKTIEISKLLDINQLRYRLSNYRWLFEIDFKGYYRITKKYETELWELKYYSVKFDEDGFICNLEFLKENGFINHIDEIENIYQFTEQLIKEDKVDVTELKQAIFQYETNIELRNKILNLIALKLLYNSLPIYGYPRAKSFIRTFNKEFGLNLKTDLIDEIMSVDYSKDEEVKKYILSLK